VKLKGAAGPSFNQGVGGSIPALVDFYLSKALNPELLPVAASRVENLHIISGAIFSPTD